MRSFKEISDSVDCDKTTYHSYDRFYPLFLENRRLEPLRFLEIGLDEGRSVKLWREYLPNAELFGVDIINKSDIDGVSFLQADQSVREDLERIANQIGTVNVIVDDGSHVVGHQILTFEVLFPMVQPGGLYVVEDIETSFWPVGTEIYGYPVGGKTVLDFFVGLLENVNAHTTGKENSFGVESVLFFENAVVIQKLTANDLLRQKRPYRFDWRMSGHERP
jgi:hypothetical protein